MVSLDLAKQAFSRASHLLQWLERLDKKYFLVGDGAYQCTRKVLIPFSGSQKDIPENNIYNFYLSQIRIRIEMAFVLLTTKWRIFRCNLNYSPASNSLIVQAAMTLHNFVIDVDNIDRTNTNDDINDLQIEAIIPPSNMDESDDDSSTCMSGDVVMFETTDPDYSAETTDTTRRDEIVNELNNFGLKRPSHNITRNLLLHN